MAASVSTAQAIDLQAETREVIDTGYAPRLPTKLAGSMKKEHQRVIPIGGVTTEQIEFQVPAASPSSGGWIDLRQSYIQLRLAVRKQGSRVADPPQSQEMTATGFNSRSEYDLISPETSFVHALWRRIRTYMGSVDVSDDSGGFEWWSMFVRDALTKDSEYGHSSAKATLAAAAPQSVVATPATSGFQMNDDLMAQGFQAFTVYAGASTDAINWKRMSRTRMTVFYRACKNSFSSTEPGASVIELIMKPECGIWNTQYYLPSSTELRVELTKNADVMAFRSPWPHLSANAYIDWTQSSAAMYLCRRFPEAAVAEALAAESLQAAFQYPFLRSRTHISSHQGTETSVDIIGLLAGPRPAVVVIGVLDTYSLTKPLFGNGNDNGGQQISLYQCSGAARPSAALDTSAILAPGVAGYSGNPAEEWSAPPHVTDLYVRWGSKLTPLVAYRQPTAEEVGRAYEDYLAVSNGALSFGDFKGSYALYCFDLTDSGNAKDAIAGVHSDLGDGDRGSLEVHLQVAKNEHPSIAVARNFTIMVTGFGTAIAEVSPATGTVRRKGF